MWYSLAPTSRRSVPCGIPAVRRCGGYRRPFVPKRVSMVDRNLLHEFQVSDDELKAEIDLALSAHNVPDLTGLFEQTGQVFEVGHIVSGRVVNVVGDNVVVDIGYKSEGLVPLNEWEDGGPPKPGDPIEVLLEGMEDEGGELVLS